jgi:hypothetical protein
MVGMAVVILIVSDVNRGLLYPVGVSGFGVIFAICSFPGGSISLRPWRGLMEGVNHSTDEITRIL